MTLQELYALLVRSGFPTVYQSWRSTGVEPPPLPYIVYRSDGNDDFRADDSAYIPVQDIEVDLYTENRNISAETVVERLLTDAEIIYDKTISYIDEERMFQIAYEFQI